MKKYTMHVDEVSNLLPRLFWPQETIFLINCIILIDSIDAGLRFIFSFTKNKIVNKDSNSLKLSKDVEIYQT